MKTPIYARDLKENLRTDSFMGAGFEDALRKAEENDEDLVIGFFHDEEWRSE